MAFTLPDLPFAKDAIKGISPETFEYHHGKHHNAYVTNLNKLVEGKPEAGKSLEELIRTSQGGVFNNAAQVWNHTFFWNCMSPNGGGEPGGSLMDAIKKNFESFDKFKEQFSQQAATLFGSGWAWLVKDGDGSLKIVQKGNAGNPLTDNQTPILTLDVWEHAYYIDYRNARPKFIENFWDIVNWDFVQKSLEG